MYKHHEGSINHMKIKTLREKNNMTQQDVINKSKEYGGKFTQQQLSRWENGSLTPSKKNIEILTKVFDVEEKDLFDNGSEMQAIDFYNKGFSYGIRCAKKGLSIDSFLTYQKKFNLLNFDNKSFDEVKQSMLEFLVFIAVPLSLPVAPDFMRAKTITDIYLFYSGMYNAILDEEN